VVLAAAARAATVPDLQALEPLVKVIPEAMAAVVLLATAAAVGVEVKLPLALTARLVMLRVYRAMAETAAQGLNGLTVATMLAAAVAAREHLRPVRAA
jgi:hypothetical protein